MKKIFCLTLALAACAPSPPVFKPVEVDVPVAAPCDIKSVALPDDAPPVAATDSLFDKTRALLIEIDQLKQREILSDAQNKACP